MKKEIDKDVKNELDKDEIINIIRRQMLGFLALLIVVFVGFMYLSNQIVELQHKVRTMTHELDYTKSRIEALEKNQ